MTEHGLKVGPWEELSQLGDGTLRKFMDDKTGEKTLTDKTYGKLAAGAQRKIGRPVSIAELHGTLPPPRGLSEQPGMFDDAAPQSPPPRTPAQPPAVVDKPDVPVWASASAGDGDGAMILTETPIDWIRRSDNTLTVVDPFAFYFVGDSMEDRLYHGDMGVVNKSLPLRPGDECVFIHNAEDGTMFGLVKRLLRSNADHWHVRQLNPRKDFNLPKKKWTKGYRIVEIRPR